MKEFALMLGQIVKDQVSGFSGVITARVQYITGCNQYLVRPQGLDDKGKIQEGHYFDEDTLIILPKKSLRLKIHNPGGPQETPPPK
jgi:hypothetical protein